MDRYARQAGDDSYDSDGEADDEFERSFTSPARPPHGHDDDHSDHPSDSEDDQASAAGDDTPTTQGWGDREGISPTGNILQWSEEQVADFVAVLAPPLKQYCDALIDNAVNGEALVAIDHEELKELGVHSIGHRLTILKAVYDHKVRSGVRIEEGDYVPLSADDDKIDSTATQDDIARIIESIRLRDQRIMAAEADLRAMKQELDRIADENRKMREETLPIMRLMKDQRTPLPDPAGGQLPSPREVDGTRTADGKDGKGSSLSRKFSTKKLFLGSAPKQSSPTHPPQSYTPQPREVRDDGGTHLEASAAAMAASNHLTASMNNHPSPVSVQGQQISPTSPAHSHMPSSAGLYHGSTPLTARSFPRDGNQSARHDQRAFSQTDDANAAMYSAANYWNQSANAMSEQPSTARLQSDRARRQAPTPSPREEEAQPPATAPLPRERDRGDRDRDNQQVEIFKSFRVSIEDPCRVVLPVALKRYNIADDWRQYALYIVHGDQERCLGLEEKPLMLFKQLDKEGRKPMFMLRRHASPQEGWSGAAGSHGPSGEGVGSKASQVHHVLQQNEWELTKLNTVDSGRRPVKRASFGRTKEQKPWFGPS